MPTEAVKSPATGIAWTRGTAATLALLLFFSTALRLACLSKPYFVDAKSHVHAIESGTLLIQPPGYFLFNLGGLLTAHLLHCTPAHALSVDNLLFGELGVLFFALLCLRRFAPGHAFLLAACYAASPIVWFTADIHSTYASVTAFAPLLFLCCEDWNMFPLGCFFWALMIGFRPSDGIFVLPWLLWQGSHRSWSTRAKAVAVATPALLVWLIPTAYKLGGWLAIVRTNQKQAASVAQGLLSSHSSIHSTADLIRLAAGLLLGWGVLLPVVFFALATRAKASLPVRSAVLWIAPGLLFFALYYIADSVYVAYLLAAGLIAAGYLLQSRSPQRRTTLYAASITLSVLFMLLARPVAGGGKNNAILNAYLFKFTRWSLEHEYAPRLATLLGACGQPDVLGTCGTN